MENLTETELSILKDLIEYRLISRNEAISSLNDSRIIFKDEPKTINHIDKSMKLMKDSVSILNSINEKIK
jgi:hypothetical protein